MTRKTLELGTSPIEFIDGDRSSNYPKRSELVDDGIPFFSTQNIANNRLDYSDVSYITEEKFATLRKGKLLDEDIVITTRGTLGNAAIFRAGEYETGFINAQMLILRVTDKNQLNHRFLYYWIISNETQVKFRNHASGTAQPQLPIRDLKRVTISIPPIEKQNRIAEILSAYDDLIDNNNRRIALLEEAIHRLYREWFVHLRFPGHEHTPVVAGVPEGWENASLKQLFPKVETVKTGPFGSKLHAHDYREVGVPLILVKHVKNGFVDDTDIPLVGEHKWAELKTYRLKPQDIVVSRVGYVGAAAYIHSIHDDWFFSGQTLRVRLPENEKLHPRFLAQFYQTHYFTKMIENMATGSTRLSLNTKILASFAIPVPTYSQQLEFVRFAEPIDKMVLNLRQQNDQLSIARDALLPRLMNGSLPV